MLTGLLFVSVVACGQAWILETTETRVAKKLSTNITISCSYDGIDNNLKPLAVVFRIRLQKFEKGSQWNTIAKIDDNNQAVTTTFADAQTSGFAGTPNDTFLTLHFDIASENSIGLFQCEVDGFDTDDELEVVKSNQVNIYERGVSLDDILNIMLGLKATEHTDHNTDEFRLGLLEKGVRLLESQGNSRASAIAGVQQTINTMVNNLKKTNDGLKRTNSDLKQTDGDLNKTNEELKNTNDDLKKTNGDLKQTNGDLNKTNEELKKTNDDLKSTNSDLKITNSDLKSTNSDLNKTNGNLKKTNEDLKKNNGDLKQTNGDLTKTNDELKKTNDDLKQTNGDLNKTNDDLKKTKDDLKSTNSDLKSTNSDLKKTNGDLKSTNDDLKSTLSDLKSTNGDLNKTNDDLKTTNRDLKQTNGDLNKTNDDFKKNNDDLKSTNSDLKSTNSDLKKNYGDLNKTIGDLKSTNDDLKSTNSDLKSTNSDLNKTIGDFKKTNEDLMNAQGQIRAQLDIIGKAVGHNHPWPEGTYALLNTSSGCPEFGTVGWDWEESYAQITTQTGATNQDNTSTPIHLSQNPIEELQGKNVFTLRFCSKSTSSEGPAWPKGSYCFNSFKWDGCPAHFDAGYIEIGREHSPDLDKCKNLLSFRAYTEYSATLYCCRQDGDADHPILLPSQDPFYLYRFGGKCQEVVGMDVSNEWIYLDSGNDAKNYYLNANHPDGQVNRNVRIELCFYTPKA